MRTLLYCILSAILIALMVPVAAQDEAPINPCLSCHETVTPGVVKKWKESKHGKTGIKCYVCHMAKENDPSKYEHNDFMITAVPSPKYCQSCHSQEVEQYANSKHAWAAFMGPLKPYYTKARQMGLDPFSQETAKKLKPEEMAKRTLSPLFPDSGILDKIGLLNNPKYNHNNVNLGCIQCHGSFIIAGEDGELSGWPNVGAGRINPDGSLGSCTFCHSRHRFDIEEARKPEVCGQCHLGPDHPQIEIYMESKHGNLYEAKGHEWNWRAPVNKWGPKDIESPTCATCHMSGFGDTVKSTHDVGKRLYWELQTKKSVPQWKGPSEVDMVLERVPDKNKAEENRAEMKAVCDQCHSPQWSDKYFDQFDKVVSDYNMVWEYTDKLLKKAYKQKLINPNNPMDETPEVMHYLIWHHDGRRWRMGASMMGPDWTHWNGAVDALMNKLRTMIDDLESRKKMNILRKQNYLLKKQIKRMGGKK